MARWSLASLSGVVLAIFLRVTELNGSKFGVDIADTAGKMHEATPQSSVEYATDFAGSTLRVVLVDAVPLSSEQVGSISRFNCVQAVYVV